MLIPSLPPPPRRSRARSGIRWITPALILLLVLAAALGSGPAAAQSSDLESIHIFGWVSIVAPKDPVPEGETAEFTVTRTHTQFPLEISYKASELRGKNDIPPYTESGNVTFAEGEGEKTIRLSIPDDNYVEKKNRIKVDLPIFTYDCAFGRICEFHPSATGRIQDNDRYALSIDSPSVAEGDSGTKELTFTVNLSKQSNFPVEVDYRVSGTATADADYGGQLRIRDDLSGTEDREDAPLEGTFTLVPAATEMQITVAVNGDTEIEEDETVVVEVELANDDDKIHAATDGDEAFGTGTIRNDDGHEVTITSPNVTEGAAGDKTPLTFTVRLNPQVSSGEVTINYRTVDGSDGHGADHCDVSWAGIGSNDYEAKNGTLTFPVNTGSQEIEITVNGDGFSERDEHFDVELSGLRGPEGILLEFPQGSRGIGTGTIHNDDDFTYTVPTGNTLSVPEGPKWIDGIWTPQAAVRLELRTNRQYYGGSDSCNAGDGGTAEGSVGGTAGADYHEDSSAFVSYVYPRGYSDGVRSDYGGSDDENNLWCRLVIFGDRDHEENETVVVNYQNNEVGHGASNPITLVTITILSDDHRLSVDNPSVDEGDTGTTDLVFTDAESPVDRDGDGGLRHQRRLRQGRRLSEYRPRRLRAEERHPHLWGRRYDEDCHGHRQRRRDL